MTGEEGREGDDDEPVDIKYAAEPIERKCNWQYSTAHPAE